MRILTKAYLLSSVSSLAFAGTVAAADMRMPVKAPPPIVVVSTWAGPYIGLNAGVAWHRWKFTDVTNQLGFLPVGSTAIVNHTYWSDMEAAFTAGGQIGYNWQSGRVVYGIEGDINWVNAKASASFSPIPSPPPVTATTRFDWFATIRGRLGVTMSPTMVYVTAGAAIVHHKDKVTAAFFATSPDIVSNSTKVTWVAGGGVEHRLSSDWSVKAEGLVIGRTSETVSNVRSGETYRSQFRHSAVIARIGVNRRFGAGN
jgi:outer membrane immunogenic protein